RDRQHAFYIYAVDDKGKADPTPARFMFSALDKFPPLPIIDLAQATGRVARLAAHGFPVVKDTIIAIRDTIDENDRTRAPRDTIPSGSRIDIRWHSEPRITGGYALRYKYSLDEPQMVEVDSSVKAVSYNTGIGTDVVNPSTVPKQFILWA